MSLWLLCIIKGTWAARAYQPVWLRIFYHKVPYGDYRCGCKVYWDFKQLYFNKIPSKSCRVLFFIYKQSREEHCITWKRTRIDDGFMALLVLSRPLQVQMQIQVKILRNSQAETMIWEPCTLRFHSEDVWGKYTHLRTARCSYISFSGFICILEVILMLKYFLFSWKLYVMGTS